MGGRGTVAPVRNSLVQVKIGNKIYDAVREPRCHTCNHPARMDIETQIVENVAFTTIAERWSDVEYTTPGGDLIVLPAISATSIRNHFRARHLPLQAAVSRQLAEKRMQETGYDLDRLGGAFVDHVAFNRIVLQRVQERIARNEIQVEVRDGLAAAKYLADVEAASNGGVDAAAWAQAMEQYFQEAQRVMQPVQWRAFTDALGKNQILKELTRRINGEPPPPEAIPAARDSYTE